jgi:acyl transferase domain-containing protein/aryl carrier-like protein
MAGAVAGLDLAAVAHTLRRGRVALAARAVLLAEDAAALAAGLAALAEDRAAPPAVTLLRDATPSAAARMMAETAEGQALLRGLVAARDLERLARLWLEGAEIDWDGLSAPGQRPVELPTYPFARDRHWLPVAPPRPDGMIQRPADPVADHLLARRWTEVALPEAAPAGTLLLLTPEAGLATALAAAWPGPSLIAETSAAALARLRDPALTRRPGGLVLAEALPAGAGDDVAALADGVALLRAALDSDAADRLRLLRLHRRDGATAPRDAALAALLRSAVLEAPGGFGATSVAVEGTADPALLGAILRIEGTARQAAAEVLWREGRRHLRLLHALPDAAAPPAFAPGKAYLLAGGLGEVGRALAAHAQAAGARIAVLGRRPAEVARAALGPGIAYAACDLTDAAALAPALAALRRELGVEAFAGVLHLARAVEDGPLLRKEEDALRRVLAPKLAGTAALDAALAEEPLEWFALCSSLAAWFGLAGGADYAAACAWQDAFAAARAARVLRGERQGRSLAVAWPQWAYDLHATAAKQRALAAQGLAPLDAAGGAALLARAIAAGPAGLAALRGTQAALSALRDGLHGDARPLPPGEAIEAELAALTDAELAAYLAHLEDRTGAPRPAPPAPIPLPPRPRAEAPPRGGDAAEEVRAVLSAFLKVPAEKLGPEVAFAAIGLDSIRALQAAERLGRRFGRKLDPTIFFEHPTIGALAAALAAPRVAEAGE